MSNDKKPAVYLPKMRTRIGKAGYKGRNVKMFDPADGSPAAAPAAVVKAPAKAPTKTGPKVGLKPIKTT